MDRHKKAINRFSKFCELAKKPPFSWHGVLIYFMRFFNLKGYGAPMYIVSCLINHRDKFTFYLFSQCCKPRSVWLRDLYFAWHKTALRISFLLTSHYTEPVRHGTTCLNTRQYFHMSVWLSLAYTHEVTVKYTDSYTWKINGHVTLAFPLPNRKLEQSA
jgi:hypothetical protein